MLNSIQRIQKQFTKFKKKFNYICVKELNLNIEAILKLSDMETNKAIKKQTTD